MDPGAGARLGPFLRTRKWGSGIFVGKSGVGFFYFWAEGGPKKVVPNAHRRWDGVRRKNPPAQEAAWGRILGCGDGVVALGAAGGLLKAAIVDQECLRAVRGMKGRYYGRKRGAINRTCPVFFCVPFSSASWLGWVTGERGVGCAKDARVE